MANVNSTDIDNLFGSDDEDNDKQGKPSADKQSIEADTNLEDDIASEPNEDGDVIGLKVGRPETNDSEDDDADAEQADR
jgi:hypothetical protein